MRAEVVVEGDRLSDAKPLHYNKTQLAGVAWMERSEIQEVVFSPDSAALHLGYTAWVTFASVRNSSGTSWYSYRIFGADAS